MNPAQAKRLGYTFEVDCCEYLIDEYPEVERNGTRYGPKDRGDMGGVPDWTLQCKNTKVDQWAKWFTATLTQSGHNNTRWWAVIRKARGKNIKEALFCMPFSKGKELMTHLRDLEAENTRLKELVSND